MNNSESLRAKEDEIVSNISELPSVFKPADDKILIRDEPISETLQGIL